MTRLAVIGAGVMGEGLVRGLLGAGWSTSDVVVTDVRADRREEVTRTLGVRAIDDNREAVRDTEGVLVAVKPPQAKDVLEGLRGALPEGSAGVLSIVATVRTASIEEWTGGVPVVRAMPNSPARIGKGVTALSSGSGATDRTRALAEEIFSAVGPVIWVAEDDLDAVTALSGSGPAYIFLIAEAMTDAGVALGLAREVAATLAFATIEGAGAMLVQAGTHPAILRAEVTTPGGTTAAALSVMEGMAVRSAIMEGIRAAWQRSRGS